MSSPASTQSSSSIEKELTDVEKSNLVTEEIISNPSDDGDASAKSSKKPLSFWLSLMALNTCALIVSLDCTALSVAIPKITQELHGTTLEAFWTNISFILAQVIAQPVYTTTSDVLGRKIALYAAFALFFVGSIAFAVAPSMSVLILGRVLQGLGGGGLDVLGEIIVADMTTLQERPLYMAIYSLPLAVGGVSGPVVGAALSEYATWRWLGWINLPIIVTGVTLTFFFMRLRGIETSFRSRLAQLDWTGMAMFTTGSTLFALPLSWAGAMYPWSSWKTILPLLIGVIILVAFGFYESKPKNPVFPYRIFRNRTAVSSIVGTFAQGALLYSIMLYLPLWFQSVKLEGIFPSSISVLPASVAIIVFVVVGVIIIEFVRKYRLIIIVNHLLMAVGIGLWALWQPTSSKALLYGLQIVATIGVGTLFSAINIPMTASVANADDMGLAAGILVSFRLFGALVGLSTCSTVFNNVFEHKLAALGPLPDAVSALKDVREAVGFVPILRLVQSDLLPADLHAISETYRVSLMAVFITLSGFGAIGFFSSFFTRELNIESTDLGRQRLEDSS